METEYRRVLHKWAKSVIPDAKRITSVHFDHEEGYAYSSWTFETAHTEIIISYETEDGEVKTRWINLDDAEFVTLGELLQKLFALAEQEDMANA